MKNIFDETLRLSVAYDNQEKEDVIDDLWSAIKDIEYNLK